MTAPKTRGHWPKGKRHWPDEALPSPVIEHARYDCRGRTDRHRAGSGRYTES